jgi:hypothetical protein
MKVMKAIDFWLKVFGLFTFELIAYTCIKSEIDLPFDGVLILWFITCIFRIILFNKLLKRSE